MMDTISNDAPTLPAHFAAAMLHVMRSRRGDEPAVQALAGAAIPSGLPAQPDARITRQQYAALYRAVAAALDDEMLGLWSRPIRTGTLKYLMLSLLDAPTILVALNRFVRFWNLLLDDYRLHLAIRGESVRLALLERTPGTPVNPLGHALMMKLAHGVASWLAGRELGLHDVAFRFAAPARPDDYAFLYPDAVRFGADATGMTLAYADCALEFRREKHQLWAFLKRAPEDWTFSALQGGSVSARARAYLEPRLQQTVTIGALAHALHISVRTLNRRLAEEGTQFRLLKDGLRRDLAVHRLTHSNTPLAALAFELGFADAPGFSRAFRQWTGSSPSDYRKGARQGE